MIVNEIMIKKLKSAPARARLIFDPIELKYDFGAEHPLQASRLEALIDLLEASGLWYRTNEQTHLPLRSATIEELSLIHQCTVALVRHLLIPSFIPRPSYATQRRLYHVHVHAFLRVYC